jgi:hypothetical protein
MTLRIKALRGVWGSLYGGRLGSDKKGQQEWEPRPYGETFVAPPGVKTIPDVFLGRESEETGATQVCRPKV